MKNFKDLVNSIDYHGGDIFFDKEMTKHEMRQDIKDNKLKLSTEDYRTRVIEKSKAVAFIKSANKKTYGKLLSTIHDQHSFKIDVYPKTLADAYEMLSSHTHHNSTSNSKSKKENKSTNQTSETEESKSASNSNVNDNTGNSYLQTEAITGTDGRLIPHITCFNCNKKGHYADNCPENTTVINKQHIQMNTGDYSDDERNIENVSTDERHLQAVDNDGTSNCKIVHFSWTQLTQSKR